MERTLDDWLRTRPEGLSEVLRSLAGACAAIAGEARRGLRGSTQPRLDKFADQCLHAHLAQCRHVAAWSSERHPEPFVSKKHASGGAYLAVTHPLDGASNVESNLAVGTIFSVLPHLFRGTPASATAFMQPGRRQLAAGYAVYGPSTVLVLSTGTGADMFTLDPQSGIWYLTREGLRVPEQTSEFAIDASNQRYWEKPIQRYVAECLAGSNGPRSRDFSMRWTSSLAAAVHRLMTFGGVFIDPRDTKEPVKPGRLQLMYEAAPVAYLISQAGGGAVNGSAELLDAVPDALHERVPVILGSADEVRRIVGYHADPSENVSWQLFRTRSLFVQPQA